MVRPYGLGPGDIALDGNPAPPAKKGAQQPFFGPCLLCPNQTAVWTKMPVGVEVGLGPAWLYCVTCGPSTLEVHSHNSPQPIFGPCLLWPKGWMHQDATCKRGRPRPRRQCVRWGPSSPKGHSPRFSAHVCCRQMTGSINLPLGTEVDLGPGHIVLDEEPVFPKGAQHPLPLAHVFCG